MMAQWCDFSGVGVWNFVLVADPWGGTCGSEHLVLLLSMASGETNGYYRAGDGSFDVDML